MCAAGAHAVARYAKLPVLFQSRVRAFCTHPTLCKWAGYLKFIFQVAFLHPLYRLLLGACRVCAVGAHAVARYAKLAVIPKPRACVPHTLYMVCNGRGYLKPPEHLCLPGKNLSGWLKLCALYFPSFPYSQSWLHCRLYIFHLLVLTKLR